LEPLFVGNNSLEYLCILFIWKMVDEQRTRVEEAMTNMVNEIDKLYLRKMQVIMWLVLEK
jgi:hypothetical protein